jgi:hypothetical protein
MIHRATLVVPPRLFQALAHATLLQNAASPQKLQAHANGPKELYYYHSLPGDALL